MQAPLQKKDKSGVIICPRCHAQNFTSQTMCGRCGLVFSKGTVKKGEKKEEKANSPFAGSHAHIGAVQPPPLPGAPEMGGSGQSGGGGGGGGAGGDEASKEPPKPKRPDTLPEKGATEGPLREAGHASICPMCGAGVKEGLRRCPNCGLKLGQR